MVGLRNRQLATGHRGLLREFELEDAVVVLRLTGAFVYFGRQYEAPVGAPVVALGAQQSLAVLLLALALDLRGDRNLIAGPQPEPRISRAARPPAARPLEIPAIGGQVLPRGT